MTVDLTQLKTRIDSHRAVIGVVGLGYIGLPRVLMFARRGFHVVGIDPDPARIAKLSSGEGYLRHVPNAELQTQILAGRLASTCDFSRIASCDAVIICVPTALDTHREPDLSVIKETAERLGPHMHPGQLIVLESSCYPGMTDSVLKGWLEEASGFFAGEDFCLAFSPEREDPGDPAFINDKVPKVVAGITPSCSEAAAALYGAIFERVLPVSSTRAAELTKLLENTFRSVNIALVNELKLLCDRMGVDIWEVVGAAASRPGFTPFYPGPGLGGHSTALDPFYLAWKAREYGLSTRFIELAGEVNSSMPLYVVQRTMEALNERGKATKGARLLVLGVAYKRDVDDAWLSPALRIIDLLAARGAMVTYHDPLIPRLTAAPGQLERTSQELSDALLAEQDAVLIITDHPGIDYAHVVEQAQLVIDTRNATHQAAVGQEKVVHA
jgi:UDP-N-acetyl-D-glucosamine dehydrogenase